MSDKDKNEAIKHDVTAPMEHNIRPIVRKLNERDIALTESIQVFYTVTPPLGTTREDMLKPVFWTHVARRLKALSEVRAMPRDGKWYGIYLVLYASESQAQLKELAFYDLDTVTQPDVATDPYYVEWISPPVRYGVRRKSDKHIMKDGFQTREQAFNWKHQNLTGGASP